MVKANGEVAVVLNLTVMKGTMLMIESAVLDSLLGQVATFIKGSTKMMSERGMGKCIGLMVAVTKVSG